LVYIAHQLDVVGRVPIRRHTKRRS
jgi:hypothetical protein